MTFKISLRLHGRIHMLSDIKEEFSMIEILLLFLLTSRTIYGFLDPAGVPWLLLVRYANQTLPISTFDKQHCYRASGKNKTFLFELNAIILS